VEFLSCLAPADLHGLRIARLHGRANRSVMRRRPTRAARPTGARTLGPLAPKMIRRTVAGD
jgi:hypothetical protein